MNVLEEKKSCAKEQYLLISLGNTCHYRCQFCVYLKRRHARVLSTAQYIEILKKSRALGFKTVEFGGQGDPINFDGFGDIAGVAHGLGYNIKVLSYIQNKELVFANLPKLSLLTVNMNATNEEEFQKIHVPKKNIAFNTTFDILVDCLRKVKEQRLSTEIRISYVVHKETYLQSVRFPEKLYTMLKQRIDLDQPIHIAFHHMLITPANYALTPDKQELEKMVKLFELANQNDFLRSHTNITDFLIRTKQMVSLYDFFGPYKVDTPVKTSEYEFIKEKVNGRFWCDGCKELVFVDCNGDVFGCWNPTRMVYGFPAEEDHMFFGNVLDEPLEEIIKRKNAAGRFYPDLTKKFWKVCVVCGLNTKK
jgi:wyosine [tRNA(Phe)-imidazoG37] synthetase (radical SAM superfamily)